MNNGSSNIYGILKTFRSLYFTINFSRSNSPSEVRHVISRGTITNIIVANIFKQFVNVKIKHRFNFMQSVLFNCALSIINSKNSTYYSLLYY